MTLKRQKEDINTVPALAQHSCSALTIGMTLVNTTFEAQLCLCPTHDGLISW